MFTQQNNDPNVAAEPPLVDSKKQNVIKKKWRDLEQDFYT